MVKQIDINADIGEGYGNYVLPGDEPIMKLISSANIACGYHAGDPLNIKKTVQLAKKHGLTFPILSDPHNKVAGEFGLVYRLSPQLKELYIEFGIDLERFNGDDSWQLPIPARFILDNHGVVLSAEANPDYTNRPAPREIISAIAPDE